MRSLRATIATLLATLALLAGCSDDKDPADPRSTWTPTSTPESPTSTAPPAPIEPALPDAATKPTEAGARAFITYYFDLISYAQESGDVRALRKASGVHCDGCNAGIDGIRDHYREGGHIAGGSLIARVDRITKLSTKSDSLVGYRVVATTTHDEQTIVASDGSEDHRTAGKDRWNLYLLWTSANRWRLDVMDLR